MRWRIELWNGCDFGEWLEVREMLANPAWQLLGTERKPRPPDRLVPKQTTSATQAAGGMIREAAPERVRSKNSCGIAVILQQAAEALVTAYVGSWAMLADFPGGEEKHIALPWWFLSE